MAIKNSENQRSKSKVKIRDWNLRTVWSVIILIMREDRENPCRDKSWNQRSRWSVIIAIRYSWDQEFLRSDYTGDQVLSRSGIGGSRESLESKIRMICDHSDQIFWLKFWGSNIDVTIEHMWDWTYVTIVTIEYWWDLKLQWSNHREPGSIENWDRKSRSIYKFWLFYKSQSIYESINLWSWEICPWSERIIGMIMGDRPMIRGDQRYDHGWYIHDRKGSGVWSEVIWAIIIDDLSMIRSDFDPRFKGGKKVSFDFNSFLGIIS